MAIHDDYVSQIREALPEYLQLARMGISHQKANGGALGYPSATCLFAVVDAIGSYHRGNQNFKVPVDGKPVPISGTGDHILILNAPDYFGQTLSEVELRTLYKLSRCTLTHNALLAARQWLHVGDPARPAFEPLADGIHIYLPAFLHLCEQAVARFLAVADTVVPDSTALKEIEGKVASFEDWMLAMMKLAAAPGSICTAQATGMGSGQGA